MKKQKVTNNPSWHIYILRCEDDSLYTGITTDLARRFTEHQNGTGAKYTRSKKPEEQLFTESFPTRSEALKREAAIKRLSRKQKLELIAQNDPD